MLYSSHLCFLLLQMVQLVCQVNWLYSHYLKVCVWSLVMLTCCIYILHCHCHIDL
ncbi:hypothetical protein HanPSC8_Chr16g0705281 [Helianthus annuus]|nr:hypothetical protein HanPSC8_Chr16g0705281 [Helianthus annuus]